MTPEMHFLPATRRDRAGSLEPGTLAELAVLNRDFLTCKEEGIAVTVVSRTSVGGKLVYERKP